MLLTERTLYFWTDKVTYWVIFLCGTYLSRLCIFWSIIIPAHAQHILRAVVEFREAIELTVAVVNGRLVDTTEGGVGLICVVEERLENLATPVKVSCASQMELLCRWTNLILQVCGQTRVQEGRLCCLTNLLTQEPEQTSNTVWIHTKTFTKEKVETTGSHLFRVAVFLVRLSSYLWRAAFPPKPRKVDT